ncbi:hypothetical protein WK13_12390 [Burkholderia ubonensis]|uniref:hypothetical protein n=1 Tax=Burkholderia ubonensis TaxID=101571 RepID=UPI00075A39E1|nr:hypothetical protein [Burkholderia ubonensis]KVR14060.1 hypothetical protein WK13_12390 [Burkholderia ubonensis]
MQQAATSDGRPAPTAYAALLLAAERGYTHELFLREVGFFVTLRHAGAMPDRQIDAFLVVNDGGYSGHSALESGDQRRWRHFGAGVRT